MKIKYLLVIIVCLSACFSSEETDTCELAIDYIKSDKENIIAGQTVTLALKKSNNCDDNFINLYFSGLGISAIEQIKFDSDDEQLFAIPEQYLKKAGILEVRLEGHPQKIARISITPAEPIGIVDVFAGPKTIAADYHQPAMIVSIPKDKFGNPVRKGTPVDYKFESQVINKKEVDLFDHLHSYREIPLQEKIGKIYMSASTGDAHSKENFLEIKSGTPAAFKISANQMSQFANEKENTIFQTDLLKDKFGNQVIDGTKVKFSIYENKALTGSYDAFTIGGIAKVSIRNPSRAQTISVKAHAMGSESDLINVTYVNSLDEIPYSFNIGKQELLIGPLKSELGNVVPDGFLITIIASRLGKSYFEETGEIEDGYYLFKLNGVEIGDTLLLRCGGIEKYIKLN